MPFGVYHARRLQRIKKRYMHITILTIGTRGDVQPYIALGMGLHQAGYDVRLVTHAPFESMIRRYGLDFAPIASNMQANLQSQEGRALLASGRNPWRFVRGLQRQVKKQAAYRRPGDGHIRSECHLCPLGLLSWEAKWESYLIAPLYEPRCPWDTLEAPKDAILEPWLLTKLAHLLIRTHR